MVENYKADFLGRKEIDIFIPSLMIGIEFDGESWHTSPENDEIKTKLCNENGIQLIRVMESNEEREGSINIHITKRDREALSKAIERIVEIVSEKSGQKYQMDVDVARDSGRILEKKYTYRRCRSLGAQYPELAKELHPTKNGMLNADMIPVKSNFVLWWKCPKGHEWEAIVSSRTGSGNGCPICANQKLLPGYNDLATTNPDLAKEWHPTKNSLTPDQVMKGSSDKIWWKCSKGHEWEAIIYSRARSGCPYCANKTVLPGYNDLATANPDLAKEWHPTKNGGIVPSMVAPRSNKKYWWICKNGHEIYMTPSARTSGHYCGVCDGKVVVQGINDLESQYPELSKQWHPTKNGNLKPSDVTPGSSRIIWWMCPYGHEWEAMIQPRTKRNIGCPYCSGYRK